MNAFRSISQRAFHLQLAFVVPVLGLYVGELMLLFSVYGIDQALDCHNPGQSLLAGEVISSLEPSPVTKEKSIIDAARKSLSGQKKLFLRSHHSTSL